MRRQQTVRMALVLLLSGGILIYTVSADAVVTPPSNGDYTAMPAFLPAVVPPNILLVMDNSGSMETSAYHANGEAYDAGKPGGYGGYFDPTKCYTYGSSRFTVGIDRPTTGGSCGSNGQWDGSFLNYITMTRLEIAKAVMMGGKCAPRSINGNCYPGGKLSLENSEFVGSITMSANSVSPLTGTKCFDRSGDKLVVKDSGCSGSSSYTLTVDVSYEPTGIIQAIGGKARFGLMEFKSGPNFPDGGKVLAYVGDNMTAMVNAIENTSANTWTPLAESLYEATRYFAQVSPAYGGTDYTPNQNNDPYYFKSPWASNPGKYVPCCKSFVIIFTDGQPTKDQNIPAGLQDLAHSKLPHVSGHDDVCSAYHGGVNSDPCQDNGTHYLDDVAYYAHTTDLRPASGNLPILNISGVPIPGPPTDTQIQNLTVYTFYAFGTGSNILKDAAKAGGFEDVNGNSIPDLEQEYDKVNNYTGAKGPDGIPDTYFESSSADDLKDKLLATINSILQRSASGTSASVLASSSTGEGALYQAYFFPQITEGLNTILWPGYLQGLWIDKFGNLREDTVLDQKLIYEDDLIIKMVYDSATGIVNVERYRDTDGDGKADLTIDSDGDGKPDKPQAMTPNIDLNSITPLWEAGKQLALKDASTRNIYTWIDRDADGIVDANEEIPFTTANANLLQPYLASATVSTSTDIFNATNLITWIRGEDVKDGAGNLVLRDRTLTVPGTASKKVWKFGDPVHSSPTAVAAPRERYDVIYGDPSYQKFYQMYRDRRQVVYVGANDGMLHAFNGGFYTRGDDTTTGGKKEHGFFSTQRSTNPVSNTPPLGDELWAFIPMELLPHLRWLASETYSHVYYVDLKPKVTDVRIFCDSGGGSAPSPCITGQNGVSHPDGWGTILIAGFRFGGSCGAADCKNANNAVKAMKVTGDFNYDGDNIDATDTREFYSAYFVLDITDPEATGGPKLLWSFTDANLGFSTSYPSVARLKPPCNTPNCKVDTTDAKWFILFGSGPTNYKVDTIKQGSRLFAYDLLTTPAPTKKVFDVSTQLDPTFQAMLGDWITVDTNLDYRVDVAYGGSLINDGSTPWRGEMYRLTTPCPGSPCSGNTWGIAGGNRTPTKLISTFGSGTEVGPITGAPTVTKDDSNNVWVFFGTGRFYDSSDKSLSEQQYFYGIKDSVQTGCVQSTATSCLDNDLVDVTTAQVFTDNSVTGLTSGGITATELTGTSNTSVQSIVASKRGWVTKLLYPIQSPAVPPRERVLAKPTVVGGIVFFPSFVPDDDLCLSLGKGYLYALFYLTGTAYNQDVIGTSSAGLKDQVKSNISLGDGQTGQLGVHIGAQGSDASGTSGGEGCQGSVSIVGQSSTGMITKNCVRTQAVWSRYISWNDHRL
ncbi:pilus assembly protein [Candidatus Nitrospira bockiana]